MQTPDLIKLAPTLSAEERYKLVMTDCLRMMDGEQPVIGESEQRALVRFVSLPEWREYTLRAILFKQANAMWVNEMEIEKLRIFALSLLVSHQLERVLVDAEDDMPKEKRAEQYERLRDYVAMINEALPDFWAYRDAIPKLEQETYGMPVFGKNRKAQIVQMYALAESSIANHNETVRRFCSHKDFKKLFKPMMRDMDSYLIKKDPPDPAVVDELIETIKHLAESERGSRE